MLLHEVVLCFAFLELRVSHDFLKDHSDSHKSNLASRPKRFYKVFFNEAMPHMACIVNFKPDLVPTIMLTYSLQVGVCNITMKMTVMGCS